MNLDFLNETQLQAVKQTEGPVMVLAGAGSGKTRTLVARIQYLIEEVRAMPYRILAMTFSNKAAGEMRERVLKSVDQDVHSLKITTFHAFCAMVLRSQADHLGISKNFTIYDDSESKFIVKEIMRRHGLNPKEVSPYDIINYIEEVNNSGHYFGRPMSGEEKFSVADEFYLYFKEYEEELHRANALDFGGLITGVIELFEKFPDVLFQYADRYRYVMVDEYQDTNRAQFILMNYLASIHHNVCVVGDEDQSIYSWRGADIRNIMEFERVYPKYQLIKLEQNYRSSKKIIEAAGHVIENNQMRKGKTMWTDNDSGEDIKLVQCAEDRDESSFIAGEILDILQNGGKCEDIAIFYRTNSQSRLFEDHMRMNHIPYRVVGGLKFYDRKEIKDVLAYMRLVANPNDTLAFARIINVPARGIGAVSIRKLEDTAQKYNMSLLQVVDGVVQNIDECKGLRLSAKVKQALKSFATLISELRLLNENGATLEVIYENLLNGSGYMDFVKQTKDYEAKAREENLNELKSAFAQYDNDTENPTLNGFLETIALDSSTDDEKNEINQTGMVSLMTIHGSKGLEFPYVFVTGAEEDLFPSYQSTNSEEGIEEERRLFYVAMTRAMKKLYVSYCRSRLLFGQIRHNPRSRFVEEIPENYYELVTVGTSFEFDDYEDNDDYEDDDDYYDDGDYDEPTIKVSRPKTVIDMPQGKYSAGMRINHKLYGNGEIVKSEGFGDAEKVEILFDDHSRKKFMVKFSPLTVIEK